LDRSVTLTWRGAVRFKSQYAPVADAHNFSSARPRCHNLFVADMNIDENAVLRLRICGHAACRAVFTICICCDRGQRYCSPKCHSEVRRRQRRETNRRYQQSEPGGSPIVFASSSRRLWLDVRHQRRLSKTGVTTSRDRSRPYAEIRATD